MEQKKTLDKSRISSLHEDYKKYQAKKKQLQSSLQEEQGVTFQPKLFKSNVYQVNGTFMERNDQYLQEKSRRDELISEYQEMPQFDTGRVGDVNSAVDRLYSERIDRHISKQSHDPTRSKYKFEDDVKKETQEMDRMISKSKGTLTSEDMAYFTFKSKKS